jgi:hypothetical protein
LKVPALIFRTALLAALLFLIAPGLYLQTSSAPPDDVAAQALKFTALYGAIEQHYVEPVDPMPFSTAGFAACFQPSIRSARF